MVIFDHPKSLNYQKLNLFVNPLKMAKDHLEQQGIPLLFDAGFLFPTLWPNRDLKLLALNAGHILSFWKEFDLTEMPLNQFLLRCETTEVDENRGLAVHRTLW